MGQRFTHFQLGAEHAAQWREAHPDRRAQVLGNHTGIGWTLLMHTSDWTLSLSFGPRSDQFNGLLKNTDAFVRMTRFMGINHRNPSMTIEEARKFVAFAPALTHRARCESA